MKGIAKAALFCFALLGTGVAQQGPVALTVDKVTPNIYMVKGGVCNTAFVVGKKEVLAIDAEMTSEQARQMIAEIKKVTPNPVTKLILTHSDADHANGMAGFPPGLEIIANAAAKKEMEEAFKAPAMQALEAYLPNRTFDSKMELALDGEKIELLHFGPAHTSGDIVIFFPAQKLAVVGDLVFISRDPLIHRQKGGTSAGLVNALKQILALKADRYMAGHDRILAKSDVEGELKAIEEEQAKVKAMIKEGKSLDEVKRAFGVDQAQWLPGLPISPAWRK